MQGALARGRGAQCPKIRRATFGCPAVRVRVPRSLCGGDDGVLGARCSSVPATGESARDDPRPGVVRAKGQGRSALLRPGATASPSRGEKRGSVAGAVALIVGTSIGSGILAVPQRTAPAVLVPSLAAGRKRMVKDGLLRNRWARDIMGALTVQVICQYLRVWAILPEVALDPLQGFVPSAACMVTCWAFLVADALLIAEINVHLRRRRNKDDGGNGRGDLEVISVKSMAQETLGEWGGHLATATYLFLSYTSMVAYASKSGEVLSRLVPGVPEPVSGAAFTAALALLVAGGGTAVTDRVNQLLTFVMIGLLLTIEVSAVVLGGGLSLPANANWEQVPAALPVIIFTLVFHDIAPVICAYLEGDLARIRLSILVGSLVPLLSLLVWDDIALGLPTDLAGFDILDMLKTEWSYTVVQTFSLLAVGTSLIGTLLGASQFFIEQMTNSIASSPAQKHGKNNRGVAGFPKEDGPEQHPGVESVLEKNKLSYAATAIVVVPTMLIAATVPNSFSIATDIAGGYCMTILYGVLPPLMAWAIGSSKVPDSSAGLVEEDDLQKDYREKEDLTNAKPVLVGMGVFSVLLVFEQIVQDFLSLNASLVS